MAASILTCVLAGFATAGSPASEACVASRSIGIIEMPQEAEAALLPNPPAVAERQRLSGNKVWQDLQDKMPF